MTVQVETIQLTPELARYLLDNACDWGSGWTLTLDEATIASYAETMAAGDWQPGSRIDIYADGQLREGGHRCCAVWRSGVSVPVTLMICDSLFPGDQPSPRRFSPQLLHLLGTAGDESAA